LVSNLHKTALNSETLILAGGNLVFLLMAIHLFTTGVGNKLLNRLMGTLFLTRTGQITIYLLAQGNELHNYPNLYLLLEILVYLTPSCFLLYAISFTQDKYRLHGKMWLAFLPLVYALIDYSPWLVADSGTIQQTLKNISEKKQIFHHQEITLLPAYWHNLFRRGMFFIFTLGVWPYITRHFKNEPWTLQKKWMYFLVGISTINQSILMLKYLQVSGGLDGLNYQQQYAGDLLQYQIIIMLICFSVLIYKPQLLYGHLIAQTAQHANPQTESTSIEQTAQLVQEIDVPETPTPLKRAPLDDERLVLLSEELQKLMEEDKLYLNPNLQISDLSAAAGIPVHHCSYILNYSIGKSFRDFINGYRIALFLERFPHEQQKKTVEAIALESGFKNIATFYNAFKKEKGVQPYEYMNG